MADDEAVRRVDRRGMRTGYTTGACSAAAAKAATMALITGVAPSEVTIHLPIGRDATFVLHSCEMYPVGCCCSVIKDAGDDPDVTHGAEIWADVQWTDTPGIHVRGGEGVGVVTLPGLGLEVGGPAINPVPRRMITESVLQATVGALGERGLTVEISVPKGAELAKKTLNGRLGIVGGISILGTTGIVQPYSTASWQASVEQAIDVAAANGAQHIVLCTGGRAERFARAILELPPVAFVEMGPFTGKALRRSVRDGLKRVSLAGMVGKFSKLAQGNFQIHARESQVDPRFLAEVARSAGASNELAGRIEDANTARHVQEMVREHFPAFFEALAVRVATQAHAYVQGHLQIDAILFDFDGMVLGRAHSNG